MAKPACFGDRRRGFIGSHLVEALLSLGVRVRAFVRYNSRQDPGLLKLISQPDQRQIEFIRRPARRQQPSRPR
jgi:nucleoside-diphosphate-sugar epimerase